MRSVARPSALVAVALLLAGCASGTPGSSGTTTTAAPDEPTGTSMPSTPAATPSSASPEPTVSEPPFLADTAPDERAASSDALLSVTDVTTGQHDGYDRVVLTFGGTGTPGWRVEYVDQAVDDPSDQVLDVAGDATLRLILLGTGYPLDTGQQEWTGSPLVTSGYTAVREVVVRGVFEGQTLGFVGVDAVHPFRVFALSDPTRVVVDVAHDE